MAKILSKSGESLADVYDIKGSIAGIDDLISEEVHLTHEMGATIFSERMAGRIVEIPTGDILKDIQFNINFSFSQVTRILGIAVLTDDATRLVRVQVSVTSPPALSNTDVPFFLWDSTGSSVTAEVLVSGSILVRSALTSVVPFVPNLLMGQQSARPISTITLRGLTLNFGAGTVNISALVYVAFPELGGVSSRGLPIPGW